MTEPLNEPVSPAIRAIEDAIVRLLEETELFEEVTRGLIIEPQGAPAANVSYEFFVQGQQYTGRLVEFGHRFTIVLVFDYTVAEAYETYQNILWAVQRAFLRNPNLDETCYYHRLRDAGRAVPLPQRGQLTKALEVVAEVEEEDDGV